MPAQERVWSSSHRQVVLSTFVNTWSADHGHVIRHLQLSNNLSHALVFESVIKAGSVQETMTDSPVMERVTEPAEKSIDDSITRALEAMSLNPLKPKQLEAVRTFMSGRDTFVSLPTGYGKSVIYAILPLAFDYFLGMYAANFYS